MHLLGMSAIEDKLQEGVPEAIYNLSRVSTLFCNRCVMSAVFGTSVIEYNSNVVVVVVVVVIIIQCYMYHHTTIVELILYAKYVQ